MNIKAVQIHQLSKKHLRQQINSGYRYIRSQKSKSFIIPPISITIHHKARKRLCNPANWSRACPTKLPQECIVFFLLRGRRELNSKSKGARKGMKSWNDHLFNTLLICSTGKFNSSASLSASVICLNKVRINSSVTCSVTCFVTCAVTSSVTRLVTSSSCS